MRGTFAVRERVRENPAGQIVLQLFYVLKESGVEPDGLRADYVLFQVVDEQGLSGRRLQLLYRVQVNGGIGFDDAQSQDQVRWSNWASQEKRGRI
jgi:hypothetical protein